MEWEDIGEIICEEIMGDNFPEILKDISSQIQEPQAGKIKRNPLSDIFEWN